MNIRVNDLSPLLTTWLSENKVYKEILGVIRKNSEGKVWLIGSSVYKPLLYKLYGHPLAEVKDWDFIAEKIITPPKLPEGWEIEETKHGNPKLKNKSIIIDLVSLDNVHSIKERSLEPDIQHYLSGTPLTLQSIAFDVDSHGLIGEVGIQSLLAKTVGINNRMEYEYAANIYGDYYSTKRYADIFGFKEI